MLSANEIAEAKKRTRYHHGKKEILHEHDDCIRIAYEWLDAQVTTKGISRHTRPLKHIIERWGGVAVTFPNPTLSELGRLFAAEL